MGILAVHAVFILTALTTRRSGTLQACLFFFACESLKAVQLQMLSLSQGIRAHKSRPSVCVDFCSALALRSNSSAEECVLLCGRLRIHALLISANLPGFCSISPDLDPMRNLKNDKGYSSPCTQVVQCTWGRD